MHKSVFLLSTCILFLLAAPAIVMAAPMGEEDAAMDNEAITIVGQELTIANQTETAAANQTAANATTANVTENQTVNQTQNMTQQNVTQNQTENNTLVDVINQNQNLTILATAINATNLTETLSTGGPYTCFAPNDEAFGALGNDTINQLLNNTTVLRQILLYHTVQGNYTSEQLLNMTQNQTMNQTMNQTQNQTMNQTQNQTMNQTQNQTANQTQNMTQQQNVTQNQTANQTQNMTPQQNMTQAMTQAQNATELQTLLGLNLTISRNQSTGMLMVNNASVVQPDTNASNGVIHTIDRVLLPPGMTMIRGAAAQNQTMDNESIVIVGNQSTLVIVNDTSPQDSNQTAGGIFQNLTTYNVTLDNQSAQDGQPAAAGVVIVGNQSTLTYINRTV
ncbi:fasciclin domain-containing protein [Methanoculleus sp. FWC-SCC1]|uniref:Fasciclin domain-containing protein n=1 Tax=Methanoculleus frigidifontis TaxID=2584085 RepID=A0ABT8M5V3_9EURY|nr:fasciclin domain-containing protein [Methanoculleus sp. FWC-SCC1]MDN7023307.1 fasciclin domain-containing protein [Methanoculleus sp. FWC-SCC1]